MLNNPANLATPVFNQTMPVNQGPQAIPLSFDFSAVSQIAGALSEAQMTGKIEYVQSIYIDNRDNPTPFSFIVEGMAGVRVTCPGNSQAILPIFSPVPLQYIAQGTAAVGNTVDILLLNVALPYLVWGASDDNAAQLDEIIDLLTDILADTSLIEEDTDALADNLRGTYTDRSGAIAAANTWQQVAAANLNRKKFFLTVRNTSSVSIWIAFGVAPANGVYDGAFELQPGQTWQDIPPTTTDAIHVQATSNVADVQFTAVEMS